MEVPSIPEKKHNQDKEKASLSISECVEHAEAYIQANGICLLVMDVVGSKHFADWQSFKHDFQCMIDDLNFIFADFLPENDLTSHNRLEKGFNIILGDGVTGAITDSEIIPLVAEYVGEYFAHIPLRYGIAKDGYDRRGIALIK